MTVVPVDFDALQAQLGPLVVLLPRTSADADGQGDTYTGLDALSRVEVLVDVGRLTGDQDASVTVLVEHSDDGETWETAASPTFVRNGRTRAAVESPKAQWRVSWTLGGRVRECLIRSVGIVPWMFAAPAAPGGGSQPGAAVVRGPFSFAFDTPGLAAGVAVYVPTVNDVLLDLWIEIDTAFDGTTPKADVSQYTGSAIPFGLFSNFASPIDLNAADSIDRGGGPVTAASATALSLVQSGAQVGNRQAPARFVSADPILLVVSQDGQKDGTPIDSAAGAARLYLVTATPAALT